VILTAAIGNTNTRLVAIDRGRIVARAAFPSADAARARLPRLAPVAVGIASVVPRLAAPWTRALEARYGLRPFVLRPSTPTGLRFDYPRAQLGADRVCAAVGAWQRWRTDLVVVDFGTATTFNVITRPGTFRGGFILPGTAALSALPRTTTALLPDARLRRPARPLGRSTRSALDFGLWYLLSGGLGAALAACDKAAGRRLKLVVTGGGASSGTRLLPRRANLDPDLVCRGLAEVMHLNLAGESRA
jgi:type III pantothenate kinase